MTAEALGRAHADVTGSFRALSCCFRICTESLRDLCSRNFHLQASAKQVLNNRSTLCQNPGAEAVWGFRKYYSCQTHV